MTTTIVLANLYAVGIIFVVVGRSELFTEHTALAVLPVLDGRAGYTDLAGLWSLVYAGNVVGASAFDDIRHELVDHPPTVTFAAAQETISRAFFVWLIATTIAHLPHCIAGTVELLSAVLVDPSMGLPTFGEFLVLATLGNAVGGSVFVALLKYGHVVRGGAPA